MTTSIEVREIETQITILAKQQLGEALAPTGRGVSDAPTELKGQAEIILLRIACSFMTQHERFTLTMAIRKFL